MEFIINFIDFLINIISTLWTLIISFVTNLGSLVNNILSAFNIITRIVGTMPPWLISASTLTITASVIFLILGRGKTN